MPIFHITKPKTSNSSKKVYTLFTSDKEKVVESMKKLAGETVEDEGWLIEEKTHELPEELAKFEKMYSADKERPCVVCSCRVCKKDIAVSSKVKIMFAAFDTLEKKLIHDEPIIMEYRTFVCLSCKKVTATTRLRKRMYKQTVKILNEKLKAAGITDELEFEFDKFKFKFDEEAFYKEFLRNRLNHAVAHGMFEFGK